MKWNFKYVFIFLIASAITFSISKFTYALHSEMPQRVITFTSDNPFTIHGKSGEVEVGPVFTADQKYLATVTFEDQSAYERAFVLGTYSVDLDSLMSFVSRDREGFHSYATIEQALAHARISICDNMYVLARFEDTQNGQVALAIGPTIFPLGPDVNPKKKIIEESYTKPSISSGCPKITNSFWNPCGGQDCSTTHFMVDGEGKESICIVKGECGIGLPGIGSAFCYCQQTEPGNPCFGVTN